MRLPLAALLILALTACGETDSNNENLAAVGSTCGELTLLNRLVRFGKISDDLWVEQVTSQARRSRLSDDQTVRNNGAVLFKILQEVELGAGVDNVLPKAEEAARVVCTKANEKP